MKKDINEIMRKKMDKIKKKLEKRLETHPEDEEAIRMLLIRVS